MFQLQSCRLYCIDNTKGLFSFENFLVFVTVALSFLFDKHYPIIN